MTSFDFRPRTRVVFGAGEFARLGELARELGGTRCLLVADQGMVDAGYVQEAVRALRARRMDVFAFHNFGPNPTSAMVEAGRAYAEPQGVNLIVGLGGGSSMDCAKAINFVLTNGGTINDYWGYGKATRPLLPMIGVPTTAGTGSEAQSYALISDTQTQVKMACGDSKAAFRIAILDPKLTVSQPRAVTAATGYDALSHAVETLVSTRRTALSECFSREAWRLLNANYPRVLKDPEDLKARGAMLLGAHFAGLAIENAMLGATHACANPLTAHYDIPHGVAIAMLLPHVVKWNATVAGRDYEDLHSGDLSHRLTDLAELAELPHSLRDRSVPEEALPRLAEEASAQWTGRFNPRPFNAAAALEIYQWAY
ncbi:MAG: iron-containing alcohol dehydrogenase [Bryobacteraceae bacterium]|jgi:alcohol dehydrogenase